MSNIKVCCEDHDELEIVDAYFDSSDDNAIIVVKPCQDCWENGHAEGINESGDYDSGYADGFEDGENANIENIVAKIEEYLKTNKG